MGCVVDAHVVPAGGRRRSGGQTLLSVLDWGLCPACRLQVPAQHVCTRHREGIAQDMIVQLHDCARSGKQAGGVQSLARASKGSLTCAHHTFQTLTGVKSQRNHP